MKFPLFDYLKNQMKFSSANLVSVPVGTTLLYVFTTFGHIWYIESSLLTLCVTTTMNFWVNHFLKTRFELKKR